jgi:hypothetical protein
MRLGQNVNLKVAAGPKPVVNEEAQRLLCVLLARSRRKGIGSEIVGVHSQLHERSRCIKLCRSLRLLSGLGVPPSQAATASGAPHGPGPDSCSAPRSPRAGPGDIRACIISSYSSVARFK